MSAHKPAIDPKLLALMTGHLGNGQQMEKVCSDFAAVFNEFLPDMIETETGLKLGFIYDGCAIGLKNDLIEDLDDFMVLIDGSLRNWCSDFTIACPSILVMSMVECLLGGEPNNIVEPVARPASRVELEMTPMVTDKISSVIKSAVNAPGNYEPLLSKPYNAANKPKLAEDHVDVYAAAIRMKADFGKMSAVLHVIVPQKTLLKTIVRSPAPATTGGRTPEGWVEHLKEQVQRSEVRIEARIHLTPLKLGTISKLQAGDVIPFLDKGDVRVQVNANGHDLYSCEFGRSGEQYTVRVKDTAGGEEDLLRDLLG